MSEVKLTEKDKITLLTLIDESGDFMGEVERIITARLAKQRAEILDRLPKQGCNPHKEWHEGYNTALAEVRKAVEG